MKKQQQGAILIVGMILMAIIMIVGISTISTTQMEEKMASNLQQDNQVFQAVEAAIEEGIDSGDYLNTVRLSGVVGTAQNVVNEDARISSWYQAQFNAESTPIHDDAASIDLGNGGQMIAYYNFDITAQASLLNSGASATHVQGIFLKGLSQNSTAVHKVTP